ncbi:MAG: hypothetical protein IT384_11655 [Deltaproteobacteria bacterium]|nr:hypothetical protein [Deltaproteobacteria bacterium]
MSPTAQRLALCLLSTCGLNACSIDEPCDDDQVYELSVCLPKPKPPQDAGVTTSTQTLASDAGSEDGETHADAAPLCAPYEGFGVPCSDLSQCTCETNFCPPGWPQLDYCTRTGCIADPSVCPPGWSCEDLSRYQAGLPSVCVKP